MAIFPRKARAVVPNDEELFTNVSLAIHQYLELLNDIQASLKPLQIEIDFSDAEFFEAYRLVIDAALSNLNFGKNSIFTDALLEKIPIGFSELRMNVHNPNYLPPPMPQKYVAWIQGLLNDSFHIDKKFESYDFGVLWYLVAQALMQGNPPRREIDLSAFEDKFIDFVASGTVMGLQNASKIKVSKQRANRHLAQLLVLSMILGIKFSIANQLRTSD